MEIAMETTMPIAAIVKTKGQVLVCISLLSGGSKARNISRRNIRWGGMNKAKKFRRPGLQERWQHVVNSLERIIPVYELGSNRIALFADTQMRTQAVKFAVRKEEMILDLGSGPA